MPKIKSLKHITISVILLILSLGLVRSSIDVFKGGRRLDELKKDVASLESKKLELEEAIEYKKTDEYVEERARNDLSMIKPGEKVFVVVGQESTGSKPSGVLSGSTSRNKEKAIINESNAYKWFKLFF